MRLQAESMGVIWSAELEAILACDAQEMVVTGGYRGGKSLVSALKIWFHEKFLEGGGLFWIVGPTYVGATAESDYIYQWALQREMIKNASMPTQDARRIELINGTVIETRSSEHPERLASAAPDMLIVVEAGQHKPGVRDAVLGRALQRNAPILYSGTMEDDTNKRVWTWFYDLALNKHEDESGSITSANDHFHSTFRLPSWANRKEFPGGYDDPKIQRMKRENDEYTFSRKFAGIPTGVQFAVYPQVAQDSSRLRALPPETKFITHVGGSDYGTEHPSALVVCGLSEDKVFLAGGPERAYEHHIVWVREVWWDGDQPQDGGTRGDPAQINAAKRYLQRTYRAHAWATDPNQRWQAKQWGGTAVSGSDGSRENRIGYVRSRLQNGTLLFDLDGPGVADLYEEMKTIRRRQLPDGELKLLRVDDDRTAALEDAIELLDQQKGFAPPARIGIERVPTPRRLELPRV